MTEKRFWILNVLTKSSGIKDGDKLLSFDEVVNLLNELSEENEQLKSRINELEEKVYHNLAWFLMYKGYFGIDLGEAIWNNADIQNHEQERELLNEYISIAKKRYRI